MDCFAHASVHRAALDTMVESGLEDAIDAGLMTVWMFHEIPAHVSQMREFDADQCSQRVPLQDSRLRFLIFDRSDEQSSDLSQEPSNGS